MTAHGFFAVADETGRPALYIRVPDDAVVSTDPPSPPDTGDRSPMYAHVTTYRLGTSAEVADEIEHAAATGDPISDQTVRTIASYWHSPAPTCRNLTALSHGRPFDLAGLADEIVREVGDVDDRDALEVWADALADLLADV